MRRKPRAKPSRSPGPEKAESRELAPAYYIRHVIQVPVDLQMALEDVARGMRLTTWQVCLLALRVFVRYKHRSLFGRTPKLAPQVTPPEAPR